MALTIDLNLVGAGNTGMSFDQRNAAIDQQVAIDSIESIDFTVFVGNQGSPIKTRFAQGPAKTRRLLKVLSKMCAVDQQFLRHAADVDTCPPQITAFSHRYFCTKTGRKARSAYAARTRTNDKQIKFVGHFYLLSSPSA